MKKFIEVEEVTATPLLTAAPGLYYDQIGGNLYHVGNNTVNTLGFLPALRAYLKVTNNNEMDFLTICRFIAIGADVNNAKKFVEEKE